MTPKILSDFDPTSGIVEPPAKQSVVSSVSLDHGRESEDLDKNPFLDTKIADHYRKIYEVAKYECRHVFDPDLTWTYAEERRLVRKLDVRVCLWACIMFFALQVDRKNLVQAVSGNMLDQLHLSTNDYNYGA